MSEGQGNAEAAGPATAKAQQDGQAAVEKCGQSLIRGPSKRAVKPTQTGKLKKVAWRTTAALYWAWWLAQASFGSRATSNLSASLTGYIVTLLSSVGFRPVHHESLGKVLRIGWLLTIAGFKPMELVGLAIYIFIAPATLLGYLVFRELARESSSPTPQKTGLRPPRSQRRVLMVVSLSLLGWYVLYGEATSRGPLIVGAGLSGILFLLLLGLAFQRVRPVTAAGSSPAWIVDRVGLSFSESIPASLKKVEESKKRQDAVTQIFIYKKARRLFRFFALVIRGQSGRNKLYLLLLLEYVLWLALLGSAAILSWGLATKAAVAPSALPVWTFVGVSSATFFRSSTRTLWHPRSLHGRDLVKQSQLCSYSFSMSVRRPRCSHTVKLLTQSDWPASIVYTGRSSWTSRGASWPLRK